MLLAWFEKILLNDVPFFITTKSTPICGLATETAAPCELPWAVRAAVGFLKKTPYISFGWIKS